MNDELERQIAALRVLFEAGQLDEVTYHAAVAGLQVVRYQAEASQGSAVAQDHSLAAAAGGFINTGLVEGNVYLGRPTDDPAAALRIYRQVLLAGSELLPLRGVDIGAGDPTPAKRLGLANVYVDLDTTASLSREREALNRAKTRDLSSADDKPRPLSALQAVRRQRKLVLTGDPGSGKSTFVHHLAYCLAAHALQPEANWLAHLPDWPARDAELLPILVTLRDFAADPAVAGQAAATPQTLWDFIVRRLAEQKLAFAAKPIEQVLERGGALVLLDGLDEVTGVPQRQLVRDAVAAFARRYGRNRFLVTCRILSYQAPTEREEPDLRLEPDDFPAFELAPFDAEKIDRFIAAWYVELVRINSVRSQEVEALVNSLKKAVRRPDLWRLAPNPLLLSVMALLHAHQSGRLPDARAQLYEQTVEMLLWRWEEKKQSGRLAAPPLRELLSRAGRTDLDLKRALWQLAYEAHSQTDPAADAEALGDIAEAQLTHALERLKRGDWNWVYALVAAMKLRAGLLLERNPGVFTFPHRTFQEYLAGAHLSTQNDFARQSVALAAQGSHWREALLLAAGRLVQSGDVDKALGLVNRLAPEEAATDETAWRRAWLAGDALQEIGVRRADEDDWGHNLLARVRQRLAELVGGGYLTPRERAEAGVTLAALGDERPGVGVRQVKGQTLPDLLFDYVPPGPFWMGSPDDDPEADRDEKPLHPVDIPYGYWVARYPLTMAQWRAFAATAGYTPRYPDSLEGTANQPAVWLTWYDAMALCSRLSAQGHRAGWLPDGWYINLPSEAEWEKAARGGQQLPVGAPAVRLGEAFPAAPRLVWAPNRQEQRRYPWGDEAAEAARANYQAAGIGRPSSVGAFPAGAGPYRTLDLAGNVWEWTRSRFERYPYNPTDGREKLATFRDSTGVSLRGGAYYNTRKYVRCAARNNTTLNHRAAANLGVRVVVSPFPPLPDGASGL